MGSRTRDMNVVANERQNVQRKEPTKAVVRVRARSATAGGALAALAGEEPLWLGLLDGAV